MDANWLVVALSIVGVLLFAIAIGALVFGFRLLPYAIATAVALFFWAAEQGFIGVALYIILWVVATPLMIIVCIIGGLIQLVDETEFRKRFQTTTLPADDLIEEDHAVDPEQPSDLQAASRQTVFGKKGRTWPSDLTLPNDANKHSVDTGRSLSNAENRASTGKSGSQAGMAPDADPKHQTTNGSGDGDRVGDSQSTAPAKGVYRRYAYFVLPAFIVGLGGLYGLWLNISSSQPDETAVGSRLDRVNQGVATVRSESAKSGGKLAESSSGAAARGLQPDPRRFGGPSPGTPLVAPSPNPKQFMPANVCTDGDMEYAQYIGWGAADEAYEFGVRIQQAVEARDLQSLFGLVVGELKRGPRRRFVQNKSFSDIFPEEWRQRVLSERPECRPVGWRGYMLGAGSIWYGKADGRWSISSINGATEEPLPTEPWVYDGAWLTRACFTTGWSDIYGAYRERFEVDADFDVAPGRYVGGLIPIGPIVSSRGEEPSLAIDLSHCLSIQSSGNLVFTDGWVSMTVANDSCFQTSDPASSCPSYRVVKRIAQSHCGSLAPNFSDRCVALRLVEIIDPTDGSIGVFQSVGIFGIIDDPASDKNYVVPLVNFDHLNAALNYIDTLE